jgi:hypothetical protein
MRTQDCFCKVQVKIEGYVKENWGFPFIAGFMVLLVAAAAFLAAGWTSLADAIAVCAYFALVAGIIVQLVCFSKNKRKNEGVVLDGSS